MRKPSPILREGFRILQYTDSDVDGFICCRTRNLCATFSHRTAQGFWRLYSPRFGLWRQRGQMRQSFKLLIVGMQVDRRRLAGNAPNAAWIAGRCAVRGQSCGIRMTQLVRV